MMSGTMSLKTIWFENEDQFEQYRYAALNDETNPNTSDFLPSKLKLDKHMAYGVVLNGNDPMFMCGAYMLKHDLIRLKNRFYIFPNYRSKSYRQALEYTQIVVENLVKPLVQPGNTHIMSMSNRGERNNHFNAFYKLHDKTWPNHWHKIDGYIQTGNGMRRRSWQNAITDNPEYGFKVFNHDQWLLLPE